MRHVSLLLVAEGFLFQARADACAKDRGVEWLREVILGAGLDAADNALNLIQRGDHDDGNVTQLFTGLQLQEGRIAVHTRHDQIEEDEVERLLFKDIERGPPVVGLGDGVALAGEAFCKHLAILLIVVDDEDFPGTMA